MSYYLDDMNAKPGDTIRCKANLGAPWIVPEQVYIVLSWCTIQSPNGDIYNNPSARFTWEQRN